MWLSRTLTGAFAFVGLGGCGHYDLYKKEQPEVLSVETSDAQPVEPPQQLPFQKSDDTSWTADALATVTCALIGQGCPPETERNLPPTPSLKPDLPVFSGQSPNPQQ